MTAMKLIARLREQGIRISVRDGGLELDAPKGALSEELREEIVANKPELLRLLSWSRRSSRATAIPLEPTDRDQLLQLSWAQQRLWFLDQLEPGNAAYNISWTVRLKGELQVDALRGAFDDLVMRHEALRTVFPASDGIPCQLIRPRSEVELVTHELRGISDEQLRSRLADLAGCSFDLAKGPLLRPFLLQLSEAEHVLLVVVHHIVADGASMRILFRELASLYEERRGQGGVVLPDLPVQYVDYAMWQRRWLNSDELDAQSQYWLQQLKGLPPLLELPTDRPRAAAMRYRGASVLRVLPAGLAADLRRVSREHGSTLFMTMLAAFYVLLMRYSGREDLVVGTPLGGRSRTSLEGLIGFFINTVVLRTDLGGDPEFSEILSRVREVALEAHANQDLPFEKLVELVQPERELSYSPVFQVMFDLQEEPRWKLPVRSLEVIPEVVFSSRTASFDLTLSVRQAEKGLDAMFEYDTDLFDEVTIEAMAARYQVLLQAIALNPGQRISQLPLVDPDSRRQQVHEWNTAAQPYPDSLTIAELFENRAAEHPQSLAVLDGMRSFSYAHLNGAANRLAHRLQQNGVEPDTPVAICGRRSAETFAAIVAVHKAGGCVVPLDPAYPEERLAWMLDDSGAALLLHQPEDRQLADRLVSAATAEALVLDPATLQGDGGPGSDNLSPLAGSRNLAYIMYTSGTSGQPKGVELEHTGFINYITWLAGKTDITPRDRVLQFASLSFDIAIEESLAALLNGAALVLRDPVMTQSLSDFVDGCEQYKVSWLSLPTAWWHELCEALDRGDVSLPPSLRAVVIGGEKAELPSFIKWQGHAGDVRLFNTYGPTETSIVASWVELSDTDTTSLADLPIGYPVPNVRVWVMDENFEPVPAGLPGEICIGGSGVARGYRNQNELTEARFVSVQLPDGATERLYRTGDRARYIAGQGLVFLGRTDAQLKLRGHRIEPAEVEAALLARPGVGRCAVMLQGQGPTARLIAYISGAADPGKLRDELHQKLPEYLVPSVIVSMPSLPFTANGKLDRDALPEAPVVAAEHDMAERRGQGFTNQGFTTTEQQLSGIWSDLLGIEKPGLHDDFFVLGGHSLIATRVMARVRDVFGSSVPLRALFDHPTIASLARVIDKGGTGSVAPPRPRVKSDRLPPVSWVQQRLLMLDQLEPGNAAYNLYSIAELSGELNLQALQYAVEQITRRHEVLRTRFALHAGEAVQLVSPAVDVQLQSGQIPDSSVEALQRQLAELVDVPFDLQAGPLWRVHVLSEPDSKPASHERHILLLLFHHIVADGWSMNVLYAELQHYYGQACRQEDAHLAELPLQYADYAHWQRESSAAGQLEVSERYWQEQLADVPPLLSLPMDKDRPEVQGYSGAWVSAEVLPELRTSLQQLGARQGCSLFMILLTAFKAMLMRHTGRSDLVVGTPVAGRTHTELESLLGCFLNTLVLRTRTGDHPDFMQLLEAVRQTTLDAYEHQAVPFERLLELLQPPRSAAYTPLIQVLFNLHNEREGGLHLHGLECRPLTLERAAAKFDLSVSVAENIDGLRIGFEYNSDLFESATVQEMLDDYLLMLRAMAEDERQKIATLPLTAEQARKDRLLSAPGFRAADYASVTERFFEVAAQYPERPAVSFVPGDLAPLSYAQLAAAVQSAGERVSDVLRAASAQPGPVQDSVQNKEQPRVALFLGHDAEMLVGILGVLHAGCTYVPLDRQSPPLRCRQILEKAGAVALVTTASLRDEAAAIAGDAVPIVELLAISENHTSGFAAPLVPATELWQPEASSLAYVLFTSGSTGEPKGVKQTHSNVLHHASVYSGSVSICSQDRLSLVPAYGFDAAVMDIFGALLNGACLLPLDLSEPPDGRGIEAWLASLSVLHLTPTVLRYLMQDRADADPLCNIKAVVLGGEEARYEDFRLFRRNFAPGTLFINGLGPSESTTALQFMATHDTRLHGRQIPVGQPVVGCDALLLDESGNEAGMSGELVIRSPNISPGYLGDTQLSAQKMPVASDNPDYRLYFSGDCARRMPDGQLLYAGRLDKQIKIHGRRIEPGEIETAMNAAYGVSRCAVLFASDQLKAFYTGEARVRNLRSSLQSTLPAWLMPQRLVHLESMPLMPNGKIDRKALAAMPALAESDTDYVAPADEVERALAAMWQMLLAVPRVGVNDDFFALGGHSLLAVRLLSRIHDHFDVSIGLRDMFSSPTVRQLAVVIAARLSENNSTGIRLRKREANGALPKLSWAQQRLWFLDRLEPGNAAYNLHWAARLNGKPDKNSLQGALTDLQWRHDSLRTAFGDHAGEPVQLIHTEATLELVQEDISGSGPNAVHARLQELIRQPFDLSRAPLLRVHLLEVSEHESVLLLVMHHIVADGWSMGVLFGDLSACYAARVNGIQAALPELPLQYADYADWQQRWLSGTELQRQNSYWSGKLRDIPALLELPLDYPRPPVQRFRGAWVNHQFDAATLERLHALAEQESATLFMVLLAIFKVMLMRHTGCTDIVVGAPVAGRNRTELEGLIGFFLNTLVLRTELNSDASFRDALAAVRETTLEAYDHQDLPFEKLLELLQPARSSAHSPLVQATINLHNEPGGNLQLDSLQAEVVALDRGTSKFDLSLSLVESNSGLNAGLEYNTDLFSEETAGEFLHHFGELLQAFVSRPNEVISSPRLSGRLQAMPVLASAPSFSRAADDTLISRFDNSVTEYGERPAVRVGGKALSYTQLNCRANALAWRLVETGGNERSPTGILLGHDAAAIVALLAVLKSGRAYVPLDRHSPPSRLRQVIELAGISAVITDEQHVSLLPDQLAGNLSGELTVLLADESTRDAPPEAAVVADDLAYVLFTSGSTGEPKGVMQSHAGVLHHAATYSQSVGIRAADRLTLLSAFGFDAAVMDIFGALLSGACLYPLDLREESYPGELLDTMSVEAITVLHATPTVFRYLMRSKVCRHELDAVRAVVLGGEEVHGSDFDLFRQQFTPPAVFVNGLGPSESTTAAQFFADHETRLPGGVVPVGRPVAGTELMLFNEEGKPTGLSGELAICSSYVALGYLGLPQLTAEQFSGPDKNGRRIYRTGDRVRRLPDGQLVFLGRQDDQFKLRGQRIEPAEIETVMVAQPDVAAAAVVLHQDSYTGATQLAAYYCGSADRSVVRSALRQSLPDFMVPAALMPVDELPLTANGKLDRNRLPEPRWERDAAAEFVAPRTDTEKQLLAIWSDVLGVPEISVHDDFFVLGGHSLLAAQLAARVHESMQVVVPLRRLLDAPTVAQIAEHIDDIQWAIHAGER